MFGMHVSEMNIGSLAITFVNFGVLEMELMKDRFAKLLLGEDMSGGGKGVSSALALSNAITNLAGIYTYNMSLLFMS